MPLDLSDLPELTTTSKRITLHVRINLEFKNILSIASQTCSNENMFK